MAANVLVAGTGFGGRAKTIRKHCKRGQAVILKREPGNRHDPNAIAVYLNCPRLGGVLGSSLKQIGYIKKSRAKSLAKRMDIGETITATVHRVYAPEGRDHPDVSLNLVLPA